MHGSIHGTHMLEPRQENPFESSVVCTVEQIRNILQSNKRKQPSLRGQNNSVQCKFKLFPKAMRTSMVVGLDAAACTEV
eukprot:4263682-Amphidinium_carterae.1